MKKNLKEVLKIVLLVGLAIAGSVIASGLAENIDFKLLRGFIRELVTCNIVILAFILISGYWDAEKFRDNILFRGKRKIAVWLKGCLLGTLMIGVTTLILSMSGWIKIEVQNISFSLFIFPFITMFFTALWEELVFRGYALNKLQHIIGKHAAAIAIALIFALLHLLSPLSSYVIVISTFLSGLLLNYSFIKTQHLYFPIGIHFAWNAINNLIYGNVIFRVNYINELMGGMKNPEQGLVAIFITGLAILYIITIKSEK